MFVLLSKLYYHSNANDLSFGLGFWCFMYSVQYRIWCGTFRQEELLDKRFLPQSSYDTKHWWKIPHQVRYCTCTHFKTSKIYPERIDDSNCHGDKALTIKPTSVLTKIISRINYLSLARSRIDLSIGISPHIFTNRYNNTTYKTRQISNSSCFVKRDRRPKPTSVLTKIISRINYL